MKIRKATRFIADCGRGFWNKNACAEHETNCRCWTNPKHRTCLTCKYTKKVNDSDGTEHDPRNLQKWTYRECTNEKFHQDIHFHPAHENAPDLNINCSLWESNKQEGKK